jgi:hypothetical protein
MVRVSGLLESGLRDLSKGVLCLYICARLLVKQIQCLWCCSLIEIKMSKVMKGKKLYQIPCIFNITSSPYEVLFYLYGFTSSIPPP